jgi:cell wall-associated NlpC family hydrolase
MNAIISKTLLSLIIISSFLLSSCSSSKNSYTDYTKNHSVNKHKKNRTDYTNNRSTTKRNTPSKTRTKTKKSRVVVERESLVNYAATLQHIPYIYGGKNTSGFDCSGFTSYVYQQQGKSLTGNTNIQVSQGQRIPLGQAQKGDLLFFGSSQKISHVALIVENNPGKLVVIHATSSKGVIQQDITYSSYWQPKILYAVDVWNNSTSSFTQKISDR